MMPEGLREAVAARVRPLGNKIVWFRDEAVSQSGLILPTVTLNRGEVLAVGPGKRLKRKRRYENQDAAPGNAYFYMENGPETGQIRPVEVKVGDKLEFSQYGQVEFEISGFAGVKLVLSSEDSVLGHAIGDASHAFMFQNPAGFDDSKRQVVGKF